MVSYPQKQQKLDPQKFPTILWYIHESYYRRGMAKHIMEVWLTCNNHYWHAADGVFDSIIFLAFVVQVSLQKWLGDGKLTG